ncbi:hypothetical protein L484_018020 [Morus notabilis]|uniref:Uncharacterized protein n=1 Tax=Morus notabilis TaxID=981085 RepID=W9RIH2_9ROSA|nr:hypothetical protein L484_018020 [Morus notabilis]
MAMNSMGRVGILREALLSAMMEMGRDLEVTDLLWFLVLIRGRRFFSRSRADEEAKKRGHGLVLGGVGGENVRVEEERVVGFVVGVVVRWRVSSSACRKLPAARCLRRLSRKRRQRKRRKWWCLRREEM